MQRLLATAALALCLGIAGAGATLIPGGRFGGHPSGAGATGSTHACDGGGSGVCADHAYGQTAVTWPDVQSLGVTDFTKRYRVVYSTAPITSLNYGSATVMGSYNFPNSGQLFGGNPDTGGAAFTQANRQSSSQPMAYIWDMTGGTPAKRQLTYPTGLQHHTALTNQNLYFAVIATDTSNGSDSYIGSVGPIAETTATPQAIQISNRTSGCGRMSTVANTLPPAGMPVVFQAHASSSAGGAATNSTLGDYYEIFGDTTTGWQDGTASAFDVYRDSAGGCVNYPSFASGALVYGNRDTIWTSDGTGAMETDHFGLGLTPNPLVGVANRHYPTTFNKIQKQLNWLIGHYSADPNQVHMTGSSMGAIGGAITGTHMTSPQFASVWMMQPLFRLDQWCSTGSCWAGLTWTSGMPFKATVGTAPNTLGSVNTAVLENDGSNWLSGWIDAASFWSATPSADLPFFGITDSYGDTNLSTSGTGSWLQILTGVNALQTAHRGHCFVFYWGQHWTSSGANGACDADAGSGADAIAGVAYSKSSFKLNAPYLAFDHSSDNDNPGAATRSGSTGIFDGDYVGCMECGHTWTVTTDTSGAFAATVGDSWMTRSPTTLPATTLTSNIAASGATSFTVTSTASFLATSSGNKNAAFLIGTGTSAEILYATFSGNTVTSFARAVNGLIAQAHSSGDPIVQLVSKPTGPNGGPYTSITTNITPRRLQNFKPGSAPTCTYTPFGGSSTPATVTYIGSGVFTISGVVINSGGNTSVSCS